jgi:peptidoglycan/LPS O-acetylase OafA/YrhL
MGQRTGGIERLPLLDALRTVAAVGVMLYHAPALFGVPALFSRAYLFVDLFFLLSGFVLTLSAEPRMRCGLSPAEFVRGRIVRLWPMMALGALAGAAVFATQGELIQVVWLLALSLLMIPLTTGSTAIFPLNGPQWSLLWEFAANILHGLLLRHLGERGLLLLAGASGLLLVGAIGFTGWNGAGPNADDWWLAAPRIAWSYVLGVWMARRWATKRPIPRIDWRGALVLPALALMLLPWLPLARHVGDAAVVIVLLPTLFWSCCAARVPERFAGSLGRVGSLSFPIYALHLPALLVFKFALGESQLSQLLGVLTCLLLATAVVWLGPKCRSKILAALRHGLVGGASRAGVAPSA